MREADVQKEVENLREKVRLLMEENELLTEKAEDIYLLGIISEKIGLENTAEKVIEIVVENIVTLKDISYCAFLSLNAGMYEVVDDYSLNISASLQGSTHDPGTTLQPQIETGEYFRELTPDKPAPDFIPLFTGNLKPNSYCFVPVIIREHLQGMLLCVNCISTIDYLRGLYPLLVQIGHMLGARLAALSFMDEIRQWNKTLELKVQERTTLLQESEEKYRSLVDGAADAILTSDPKGIIRSWNKGARKLFGYEPEEIITKPVSVLAPDELKDEQKRKIRKMVETGFLKNYETERVAKSGKRIPIELTATAMRNEKGEITGVSTIIRDITARKESESYLQLFRELIDRSNDAIYIISPEDGKFIDVNRKACSSLGYSREELLEMGVENIGVGISSSQVWSRHIRRVLTKGHELIEGEHRRKNGTTFPVEVNANYFKLGEKEYMLAIARDTSERKKLEDELQKSHKLESIGVLAGGIAHDFNNLLSAMQTNIFLSKMNCGPDSKAYSKLVAAEKAIKRAADLTQQLMTFSRGGLPVKKTTSMTEIIRESCDFTLRGSNVKYTFPEAEGLWPVDVDEGQMSQVIHNLILNADQSMPEGGEILIRSENLVIEQGSPLPLREGRYLKIEIHDSGTGIPKEHSQKIFDPYFTTKEMGRGLGLAITYSIIKHHGGHITVESKLGAGTTFTIYIPASEKAFKKESSRQQEALITGQGKILVMDDEELIRNSLGDMLTEMGYDVECAKDGSEAIEIYRKGEERSEPFDVVILDLTVPGGMGGQAAMKKLLEINPGIKAIVSSGYSHDPALFNYREHGFSDVITKPYKSLEDLGMTLNRLIEGT